MITQILNLSEITPLNRMQIEHLVHLSGDFTSSIIFEHKNRTINGKSMLGILSMGATGNDPVKLIVEGVDEQEASRAITELLKAGVVPPKSAPDARALMQEIKDQFVSLLGEDLVGIYLHGSLAAGCFRWDRGDIDFLVVVKNPLPLEKKVALLEKLHALEKRAPAGGFEMSVVLSSCCRALSYPVPFELHYSASHREEFELDPEGYCGRMHGEDPDLICHIMTLHAFGEAIFGPQIRKVFGPVRREYALNAIRYDVKDALEHLHERPVYYVLNLCRSVAYQREELVLSKKDGGEWALKQMNSVYQRLIQAALNAYDTGLDMVYDQGEAEAFRSEALAELGVKG